MRAAASACHVVAGLLVGHAALADVPRDDAPEAGPPGAERPSTVDAATLIRLGDGFRDTGRRALAKEAYRSAYLVGRDPRFRCEWGLAELALAAHRDAATQLDACLKDPRAGTAQQRRRYTNGLEQARREVGQLDIEVSQPGPQSVRLRARRVGGVRRAGLHERERRRQTGPARGAEGASCRRATPGWTAPMAGRGGRGREAAGAAAPWRV
ncbi:hypothetical protein WME76_01265 [Sorangium sp. So ce119]|uniref:hypothetical protein n=1 Tax=Sorangium sp. So ce119 TaxID=3133279 RepID=UPI003F634FEE